MFRLFMSHHQREHIRQLGMYKYEESKHAGDVIMF
jgi:hypothetical protein